MTPYLESQLSWAQTLPTEAQITLMRVNTGPLEAIYSGLLSEFTAEDIYRARIKANAQCEHLLKGHANEHPVIFWRGRIVAGHETVLCALSLGIESIPAYCVSDDWVPNHAPSSAKARA